MVFTHTHTHTHTSGGYVFLRIQCSFLVTVLLSTFFSCDTNIDSPGRGGSSLEDELPTYRQSIDVLDHSTGSSVSILVGCENNDLLRHWVATNTVSLVVDDNNYDDHLETLKVNSEYSESSELAAEDGGADLESEEVVVAIESINIDKGFNLFGLNITSTSDNDLKSFAYKTTIHLPKKHHYGEICWEFATPTPEVSNTVQFNWYRKWRTWFRKWTFTRAGNLNAAGECDEFYYTGNRIKVEVRSNYRNFSVYEKKNSDDAWEEIF